GAIFGPSIGGWITDNYSWHWVFLINIPIGILSLALVSMFVDEPKAIREQTRRMRRHLGEFDFVGFALIAASLGCLEVTLDRGQREDWFDSGMITAFAVIAGASFVALIPWAL